MEISKPKCTGVVKFCVLIIVVVSLSYRFKTAFRPVLFHQFSTQQFLNSVGTDNAAAQIQHPPKRRLNIKLGDTIERHDLLLQPDTCTNDTNVTVLVVVYANPICYDRRQIIRRTWANNSFYGSLGVVRVVFLLGVGISQTLQRDIEIENRRHGDILQGNFKDCYENLTYKGLMAFKWLSENCRTAKFILKVDDDVMVNMFKVLAVIIPKYQNKLKQIICIRNHKFRIGRNTDRRFYVNASYFEDRKYFPDFCQGFFTLISSDMIPALHKSAAVTTFFWIEDVFLYGLAPQNINGITYANITNDIVLMSKEVISCYRKKTMFICGCVRTWQEGFKTNGRLLEMCSKLL